MRYVADCTSVENRIRSYFHNQNLGLLLRQSNVKKERGVPFDALFQFLLTLAFTGKNLFRLLESADAPADIAKDTVYRLLNSVHANWRRFLLLFSSRVIVQRLLPLTDATTRKVLIADDTLYRRERSKKVELLTRMHAHTTGLYLRRFRMLTLGWSDGNSFVSMALSMLCSAKEANRIMPMAPADKQINGYKRRQDSIQKTTDMLVAMVEQVMTAGTVAQHLLFDSWFAFPATIRRIRSLGMHTICMLKDTKTITYERNG